MLISLDLSAAFEIIDHSIHLNRLQISFGINGSALVWFHFYLIAWSQFVHIGGFRSLITQSFTDVPQGSILGPILFLIYISSIAHIVSSFGLSQQQCWWYFAVLYPKTIMLFYLPNSSSVILGTTQHTWTLPNTDAFSVVRSMLQVFNKVKILDVTFDSRLSFDHISAPSKCCCYRIRALHHIWPNFT